MEEILTDKEKEVIQKAGELWNLICKAIPEGPARENDLDELIFHIHGIQRAFMCCAAARAYPELFRPLGQAIKKTS